MNLFDLTGEVAVVIGATGVLGGKIAEGLAAAGAKVAVLGRNAERGEACAERIRKAGGDAGFFTADAISQASLRRAREGLEEILGPVTVLVNAAGGNDPKVTVTEKMKVEEIKLEDWRANFDMNLVGGVFAPCQEFGPGMVERKRGSIINIASVAAHVPISRVVAYSAAKAAVLSVTQFLAREWAHSKVRVNSITPGFFPAEQNRRLLFNVDGSPTARAQAILAHTPMKRFGEAEELIGAAVFLASERASSFVTGSDLRVDGRIFVADIVNKNMTLADLRREYTLGGLRRADLLADPIQQYEKWLRAAVDGNVLEPTALSMATASRDGQPSARTVLLKGIDARGFVFFTNYESHKAQDLAENPKVSLLAHWRELERQIIVCGTASKVPREESEAYFRTRPEGSRLAAWASTQSATIPDRAYLETKAAEAAEKFRGGEIPTPPNWGGYVVAPETVEFWQGRVNRLHDRFLYTKISGGWKIERLSP